MNVTTPAPRHVLQTTQHQSARYSKGLRLQARKIFISASENIFYGDNNNNWRTFHYFLVAFCPRHGRNSVMSAGTTVADRDPRWLCSRGAVSWLAWAHQCKWQTLFPAIDCTFTAPGRSWGGAVSTYLAPLLLCWQIVASIGRIWWKFDFLKIHFSADFSLEGHLL